MPSPGGGIVLLGSSALFPLGVALLVIGLMLGLGPPARSRRSR
jgi:hypothetical protein